MGSGFTDFTAGDVLTADQVDGYLMRQTIMTFATTAARDSALSGVLDEGMFAYTEDTNATWYYTGSAWVAFASDWKSYTPTYNNLTVGNATNTGMYRYQLGDLRMVTRLAWGSSTSASGTVTLDIANGETVQSAVSNVVAFGHVRTYDDDLSAIKIGWAQADDAGTALKLYYQNNPITDTDPHTWATSDILNVDIVVPL